MRARTPRQNKRANTTVTDIKNQDYAHAARLNPAAVFFMGVIFVLLSITALERNVVWSTKLSLWSDAARKSPLKSRTHNNLGNCYMLLKKPFQAIEEYKTAVNLDPRNIEAYYNLAINFEDVGILSQALYYYDIFCKAAPAVYRDQRQSSCRRALELSQKMKKT